MGDALQIYYSAFDATFFTLPPEIRSRIEEKIDDMGRRLDTFPHRRLKAQNRYRLRIGDYRVIYAFDSEKNVVYLLAVGNRREIYRRA